MKNILTTNMEQNIIINGIV